MPFAAMWMGLEIIILHEVSQTEEKKYHMVSLMHGRQKVIQVNYLENRNRFTDKENKLMVMKKEEVGYIESRLADVY